MMRDLIEVLIPRKTCGAQLPLILQITLTYTGERIMSAVGTRGEGQSSGIAPSTEASQVNSSICDAGCAERIEDVPGIWSQSSQMGIGPHFPTTTAVWRRSCGSTRAAQMRAKL